MNRRIRAIALYLPQFHPVKENDKYWGKGFTEWTNVAKTKPLFVGHQQPRIPADLGFYDLRLPQVREDQANMAREYGIEGFCYWHYWFGNNKEVLEMPFDEVVNSGEPDFPFCLGWALHDWTTKTWENNGTRFTDTMIFKQEFPGIKDEEIHFYRLLKAFKDKRYIKVDGKLLFLVLCPELLPDASSFIEHWNSLAKENGLPGFHFVAAIQVLPRLNISMINNLEESIDINIEKFIHQGFDAVESLNAKYAEIKAKGTIKKVINGLIRKLIPGIVIDKFDYYSVLSNYYTSADKKEYVYPQLMVGWDRSPRAGRKAIVYLNDTPEAFGKALDCAISHIEDKPFEHRILFLNSWNEWGEGAYLEPDLRYGKGKLEELKKRIVIEDKYES